MIGWRGVELFFEEIYGKGARYNLYRTFEKPIMEGFYYVMTLSRNATIKYHYVITLLRNFTIRYHYVITLLHIISESDTIT